MRFVVCIKAIRSKYLNDNANMLDKYVINPYDLYSLLKIIEYREQYEDNHITCLCMGPLEAKTVLYRCMALGANESILLNDSAFAGSDTFATSYILCKAIEKITHDYVICGNCSLDGETGQVSYSLASRINYFCIDGVCSIKELCKDGNVIVEKVGNEKKYMIKLNSPAIIVFNDFLQDINISLFALKKAQKKEITIWNHVDIGCELCHIGQMGSKTLVKSVFPIVSQRVPIYMNNISTLEVVDFIFNEIQRNT